MPLAIGILHERVEVAEELTELQCGCEAGPAHGWGSVPLYLPMLAIGSHDVVTLAQAGLNSAINQGTCRAALPSHAGNMVAMCAMYISATCSA